jgi:HEXXH motif-containing protein
VTLESGRLTPLVIDCYRRLFGDDADLTLVPLPPAMLADATRRFAAGHALLSRSHPALAGEIDALVSEVIFALPEASEADIALHGASTFFAWGALLLNPLPHPDRLGMAEALVHESAHSLLHGLTMGRPLVENDEAERFPSPLRQDPRPMEGLVHAGYVLARMHLAMSAMLDSGLLEEAEQAEARRRLQQTRRDFEDAAAVIRAHARFTPTGAEAFAGALAYMA